LAEAASHESQSSDIGSFSLDVSVFRVEPSVTEIGIGERVIGIVEPRDAVQGGTEVIGTVYSL
jgi:hypothetical protein